VAPPQQPNHERPRGREWQKPSKTGLSYKFLLRAHNSGVYYQLLRETEMKVPALKCKVVLHISKLLSRSLPLLALLLADPSAPLVAQTTVMVPGYADLTLATQAPGAKPIYCGSSAPLNSPPEVAVPLASGQGLQFSVSGTVGENGQSPQIRPEGGSGTTSLVGSFSSFAGIGDIEAPTLSLIGMFLGNRIDPAATPPHWISRPVAGISRFFARCCSSRFISATGRHPTGNPGPW
jgi:hypothetical protein